MTLNLWRYYEWNKRIDAIITLIDQENPDCIAFQEVLTNHAFSDFPATDLIATGVVISIGCSLQLLLAIKPVIETETILSLRQKVKHLYLSFQLFHQRITSSPTIQNTLRRKQYYSVQLT